MTNIAASACKRAPIFLVAAFALLPLAGPVQAQKAGGSITVGLELDVPGFDPLKVGVYDAAALTAAAAIFDTLTNLDDKGEAQPKLALSWTHSDDFKAGRSNCVLASSSTMARRSTPRLTRLISTGRRILPTSVGAHST